MSDINIRDNLYNAILEYNNVIVRPHHQSLTDEARKGIFYTTLRRYVPEVAFANQSGRGLHVEDFECTFKRNGELESFKIKKFFDNRAWDANDNTVILEVLQKISNEHKVFYETPIMNDVNIRDKLYSAIKDYNDVVSRPKHQHLTNDALKGLFYTTLRRHISQIAVGNHRGRGLLVDDFDCTFRENGELSTFKIKKDFSIRHWDSTGNEMALEVLQKISKEKPVFYRTPIMNEISDIVNSIK